MKKILGLITGLCLIAGGSLFAGISYSKQVIDWPHAAVDLTETIDLSEWSRFSLQAIYADSAPSSHTIGDGAYANTSITVTNYDSIAAAKASVTINIATTTDITDEYVILNGYVFKAGTNWTVGTTSSTAATNLAAKINATDGFLATASGATVTATADTFGTAANSWAVTTSDAVNYNLGAATFANGVSKYCIDFFGVSTLCEDDDFDAETSNSATAKNISDAIVADSALSAVIISTWSGDVVYATTTAPGYVNWYVQPTTTAFTVENNGFLGGSASDLSASTFTETDHGFQTGTPVLLTVSAGTAPENLTDQATYYAIVLNEDRYQLASSTTNAVAGTRIQVSTYTGSGTFTIAPLSLNGTPSFKWQASNDNSNWYDLTLTSVTYSADGNYLWDVGDVDYRYIRLNYSAPTAGGLSLDVWMAGKKD